MAFHDKNSFSNINTTFGKRLQTPEQVRQASILELRSDPLLWAAYKRGWNENVSNIYQVTQNSNHTNGNDSLGSTNYQQNEYISETKMNKNSFSQQYRLQKTFIITQTDRESSDTELMETDN